MYSFDIFIHWCACGWLLPLRYSILLPASSSFLSSLLVGQNSQKKYKFINTFKCSTSLTNKQIQMKTPLRSHLTRYFSSLRAW